MSIFSWFGKKEPAPESVSSRGFGPGQSDTTLPMQAPVAARSPAATSADAAGHRGERLERRELLYKVVRECMTGAGVLSSTYKFKVLSLDSAGRKYLIMMDIPQVHVLDPARLADIEGAIARGAKERYGILVTAVYWRVNELVTAGQQPPAQVRVAAILPETPQPIGSSRAAAQSTPPLGDTQLEQEMQAFKRATLAAASEARPTRPGEMVRSGRRNPEPEPDFSDTEPFDASSPLGPSQFGGLN